MPETPGTGTVQAFPWRLHDLLDEAVKKGFESIISWHPSGRGFRVHKPKEFVRNILPIYFNQTKYKSFQRQLNMYGFHRLVTGKDKGSYFHDLLVKGRSDLCRYMNRAKVKRRKGKSASSSSGGGECEYSHLDTSSDPSSLIKIHIPAKNGDDGPAVEGIFRFLNLRRAHQTSTFSQSTDSVTLINWQSSFDEGISTASSLKKDFLDLFSPEERNDGNESFSSTLNDDAHFVYPQQQSSRSMFRETGVINVPSISAFHHMVSSPMDISLEDVEPMQLEFSAPHVIAPDIAEEIIRLFGRQNLSEHAAFIRNPTNLLQQKGFGSEADIPNSISGLYDWDFIQRDLD